MPEPSSTHTESLRRLEDFIVLRQLLFGVDTLSTEVERRYNDLSAYSRPFDRTSMGSALDQLRRCPTWIDALTRILGSTGDSTASSFFPRFKEISNELNEMVAKAEAAFDVEDVSSWQMEGQRTLRECMAKLEKIQADADAILQQVEKIRDQVVTESAHLSVQLRIEHDFASFSKSDEKRLLKNLAELLHTQGPIRVLSKERGSTLLTIELTREQAEQLLWLAKRGVLQNLEISDATVIGDAAAAAIIDDKMNNDTFDVFMCHNTKDKPEVKRIALKLRNNGILPWLDEWELRPGLPWQNALEAQIESINAAAVFVGESGLGPWQDMELRAFIQQFVARECPVIPVALRSCSKQPSLPPFLNGMTWVSFRKRKPNPIDQLIWGITGQKSAAPT